MRWWWCLWGFGDLGRADLVNGDGGGNGDGVFSWLWLWSLGFCLCVMLNFAIGHLFLGAFSTLAVASAFRVSCCFLEHTLLPESCLYDAYFVCRPMLCALHVFACLVPLVGLMSVYLSLLTSR